MCGGGRLWRGHVLFGASVDVGGEKWAHPVLEYFVQFKFACRLENRRHINVTIWIDAVLHCVHVNVTSGSIE
jgi:hypothetical protein